jgi:hypothetical protein
MYVPNGFFKRMLKLFFFLPIGQALLLERFFLLEYHIFEYLTTCGYYQNHVNGNIVLLGCNHHCLFPKHGLSSILMQAIINFVFNGIANETMVNDGFGFVRLDSMTSFVTKNISYTTKLCQNSIYYYLFFVLKLLIRVV